MIERVKTIRLVNFREVVGHSTGIAAKGLDWAVSWNLQATCSPTLTISRSLYTLGDPPRSFKLSREVVVPEGQRTTSQFLWVPVDHVVETSVSTTWQDFLGFFLIVPSNLYCIPIVNRDGGSIFAGLAKLAFATTIISSLLKWSCV